MQFLDLVRDCISVFALTPLPPNNLQVAHDFGNGSQPNPYIPGYVAEDSRINRTYVLISEPEENKKSRKRKARM